MLPWMVSVDFPLAAPTVTAAGLKLFEIPVAGLDEAESCTVPAKPLCAVTVIVLVTVPPVRIARGAVALSEKSGGGGGGAVPGVNAPMPFGVPRPVGPS